MDKLKERWEITSNIQLILILIVFAINGTFSAWVAEPIINFLGLSRESLHALLYWPLRVLIVLPVYQLTLPLVGFVFGQFRFFWNFEKKILRRMGLSFLFKKEE